MALKNPPKIYISRRKHIPEGWSEKWEGMGNRLNGKNIVKSKYSVTLSKFLGVCTHTHRHRPTSPPHIYFYIVSTNMWSIYIVGLKKIDRHKILNGNI